MRRFKRLASILTLIFTLSLFAGCQTTNRNSDKSPSPTPSALGISDYFPIKDNVRYTYEGKGNEYASYTVFNDYTADGKVQQRVDNGGTVSAKVLEIKDGKLTRLLSKGEAYYRENLLDKKDDNEEVLLMEPLAKGTTWTLKDGRVRTITETSADVSTPTGGYKAIEVTTQGTNDKTVDYYVKDKGLVKTVFTSGGNEVTSTLSKIEENAVVKQKISFYYPNANEALYYKTMEVSFKTNDTTRKVLESTYKEVTGSANSKVLTTNTKINSLYLNKDNMVYIDLSSDFLKELNVGGSFEELILQSIANTFGKYYGSDKVILTIDNKLYQSGHIAFEKGKYIKVNLQNTAEAK